MQPEQHIARADQIRADLAVLNWPEHFEMVLEGVMHEATHRLNARLHAAMMTPADEDLIHVGMPREIDEPPQDCVELIESLRELEHARALYVRGPAGPDDQIEQLVQRTRDAMRS